MLLKFKLKYVQDTGGVVPCERTQDYRYVKGYEKCQQINRRTTLSTLVNGLLMDNSHYPITSFEIVTANHLSLTVNKTGNCYILAHIYHATGYFIARPTCTTSTDDIIHTIKNDLIFHYVPPLFIFQIIQHNLEVIN